MFDIHCHLLPGIDDGPETMAESLNLARQAVRDGVTHAVLTPHIHHGRWENSTHGINSKLAEFRQALSTESILLSVAAAAELRVGPEIQPMFESDALPYLGNWYGDKVILLEMPHSHILPGIEKLVSWLRARGIIPLIAHPERNKDVIRKFSNIRPLIDVGCLFQITAGSLIGQFGKPAQKRAVELLEMGVVTVLASDAHHILRRPVNLYAGKMAASKLVGEEAAEDLVVKNPRALVQSLFKTIE